jgi:hypothetical protein
MLEIQVKFHLNLQCFSILETSNSIPETLSNFSCSEKIVIHQKLNHQTASIIKLSSQQFNLQCKSNEAPEKLQQHPETSQTLSKLALLF